MNWDSFFQEADALVAQAQKYEQAAAALAAAIPGTAPAVAITTASTGALKTSLDAVCNALKVIPPTK
jgi:hypothetical protein